MFPYTIDSSPTKATPKRTAPKRIWVHSTHAVMAAARRWDMEHIPAIRAAEEAHPSVGFERAEYGPLILNW